MTHALLLHPSTNRVYADAAIDLTVAELSVFNATVLGGRLDAIAPTEIAGVPYVGFSGALEPPDLDRLANVSSAYALFERSGDLLRPVPLPRREVFDDDLISIQKYSGKTNEQFTKLLLNVTLLAGGWPLDRTLRVLDPLCGRGTTLNQALSYGYDAAGMDLDGKDFEAYSAFIRTYLQRKRIKHRIEAAPIRRERKIVGRRFTATLPESGLTLDVVNADSTRATEFFKAGTFDVVVADAPYGVQHGSRTVTKGLKRTPVDLLAEATPGWARLLRPGGAFGIAWNTHVAKREDAAAILTEAGLTVLDEPPYTGFRHRVDASITRDILVARRPT